MGQTREHLTQHLAERLCWQVARRDDTRVARRLSRKPLVDGVYRLDEGALLDDFFHFLQASGVMGLLAQVYGAASRREMVPFVPYVLRYGVKTLFGLESMNALPAWLFSDEALTSLVGFNAHQVRDGVCQRGAAKRQQARAPTPSCPDTLADNMVQCNLRALEALFTGVSRAWAKVGVFGKRVTGLTDGTDMETTERYADGGQATRKVHIQDKRGQGHELEVTVYSWKVLTLIDAATKIPLAVQVGQIEAHEPHWTRALVTQARANLAGHARLHTVVCDRGLLDGPDLWWLDQPGLSFVVPAKPRRAVTADARAQAAAGAGITHGRRVHTVRHGQSQMARTDRIETEVVGIAGLTTYDQDGTVEHGRHYNRRDFQPNLINAVVIRKWHGKDYGPGGKTVFIRGQLNQQPRHTAAG